VREDAAALANSRTYAAPFLPNTSTVASTIYAELLASLPAAERVSPAVRLLAREAAELSVECERLSRVIVTEGLTVVTDRHCRPHPALAARGSAARTLATILVRLRVLPTTPARDLARSAGFEHEARGGDGLDVPPSSPTGDAPDWTKVATKLTQ
jgi:hypothetical protein